MEPQVQRALPGPHVPEHVLLIRWGGNVSPTGYAIECMNRSRALEELVATKTEREDGWGYRVVPVETDAVVVVEDKTRTTWIKPEGYPKCLAIRLCPDCQVRFLPNRKK